MHITQRFQSRLSGNWDASTLKLEEIIDSGWAALPDNPCACLTAQHEPVSLLGLCGAWKQGPWLLASGLCQCACLVVPDPATHWVDAPAFCAHSQCSRLHMLSIFFRALQRQGSQPHSRGHEPQVQRARRAQPQGRPHGPAALQPAGGHCATRKPSLPPAAHHEFRQCLRTPHAAAVVT